MMPNPPPRLVTELLSVERELNDTEMEHLREAGANAWATTADLLRTRARDAYAIADPVDFRRCVRDHMNEADHAEMVVAGVFSCPICSRVLKDRRAPDHR